MYEICTEQVNKGVWKMGNPQRARRMKVEHVQPQGKKCMDTSSFQVSGARAGGGGGVSIETPKSGGRSIDKHHSCTDKRHRFVSCSCLPTMGNP